MSAAGPTSAAYHWPAVASSATCVQSAASATSHWPAAAATDGASNTCAPQGSRLSEAFVGAGAGAGLKAGAGSETGLRVEMEGPTSAASHCTAVASSAPRDQSTASVIPTVVTPLPAPPIAVVATAIPVAATATNDNINLGGSRLLDSVDDGGLSLDSGRQLGVVQPSGVEGWRGSLEGALPCCGCGWWHTESVSTRRWYVTSRRLVPFARACGGSQRRCLAPAHARIYLLCRRRRLGPR